MKKIGRTIMIRIRNSVIQAVALWSTYFFFAALDEDERHFDIFFYIEIFNWISPG